MKVSDEELMVMFAAGTTEAFTMLYERFRHRIYRFALGCLKSGPDAEDAVQDVFLRVSVAAATYRPSGRFAAWIFQISANRIRDIAAQRGRQPEWLPSGTDGFAMEPCDSGSFERRLTVIDLLLKRLAILAPDDRMVLLLKELEGMHTTAIADVVGITPEAVRVRLHRIRKRLKEMTAAEGDLR